jgi:HemY protein
VTPLPQDTLRGTRLDTRPVAVEERSEHGVPRLRE